MALFAFTLPFQLLAMIPMEVRVDCGFTQGCFHYDALVQVLGAGIAVAGALLIYRLTQSSERRKAQEDRDYAAKQQRDLLAEQKHQFDDQLTAQQRHWEREKRTAQLERAYRLASQRTAAALSVQVELAKLERAFQIAENGRTAPKVSTDILDNLTRDYVLLSPELINAISNAHLNIDTALRWEGQDWAPMIHGTALDDLTAARALLADRGADLQREAFAAYDQLFQVVEQEGGLRIGNQP